MGVFLSNSLGVESSAAAPLTSRSVALAAEDAGCTAVSTSDRQHPRLEQCAKGLRRRLFIARRKKVHNVRCKSMGWQNVSQMTLPRQRTFQWVCDASGGGSP